MCSENKGNWKGEVIIGLVKESNGLSLCEVIHDLSATFFDIWKSKLE